MSTWIENVWPEFDWELYSILNSVFNLLFFLFLTPKFAVVALFFLISYTAGAPQLRETPRKISGGPVVKNVENQGPSIQTAFGNFLNPTS